MTWPDTWSQRCWVSLCIKGGSWVHFHSIVETVDIDEGDKDITEIFTVGGGRLVKREPQPMSTLTFEGYPVSIGTTTGDDLGFAQQFNAGTWDTDPYSTSPTHDSDLFKVAVLWTNQTITAGQGADVAIDNTHEAYRWYGNGAYITSAKKSFTDGVKKWTMIIKVPQFNKSGTANIVEQSCSYAQTLSAVAVYT